MSAPEVCPVDHKTRQAWLDKARAANAASPRPPPPPPDAVPSNIPVIAPPTRFSLDAMRHVPIQPALPPNHPPAVPVKVRSLGIDREISTIPRAAPTSPLAADDAPGTHSPANHEQESGADAKSGNWIYPSEHMFFQAMKRKNFDPHAEDMRSIVPIHNAVNERAWEEIKKWEAGRGAEKSVFFFLSLYKQLQP